MKTIDQLDNDEAVYTLYRALEAHATEVELDYPDEVRTLVLEGFASIAGEEQARELLGRMERDEGAAEVARASLAVLRDHPELVAGAAPEIEALLENPPGEEKLDLGIGLGLLAMAGMAMALMGSLEVSKQTKQSGEDRESSWSVVFKGSEKVTQLVTAILRSLGGPGGG